MYKTTVLVGFCPVERYDYRMRTTRSTCLITIVVRLLMTRAWTCTTVAQLSRHQTFICYKKSQVRKRDSFAHTSLRSKDKQSNFDCKRGNKNHKPNNNNTTTYRLERVYRNACERHNSLASKRPSVTKKKRSLWHIDIPHGAPEYVRGKGKREEKQVSDINLHNEKHVLPRYNLFL
jgi:hypothetical protein